MRDVSERLRDVLASGVFDVAWTADLIYDGVPRAQNLLVSDPRFSWDAGAQIQGKGSCQIEWDDVFSQSIVPREIGDLFSPFGAELQADVIVSAGSFSERVSMGRFVLDSVPEGVEYAVDHPRPPQNPVYSPWVEKRRNLVQVSPATFGVGIGSPGVGVAPSRDAQGLLKVRATPGKATYLNVGALIAEPNPAPAIGDLVTISFEIKSADGTAAPTFYTDATGYRPLVGVLSDEFSTFSLTWKWGGWRNPRLGFQNAPGTFVFRNLVLEVAPVSRGFFDGNSSPSGILKRTRWLGTPNASASVEEGRERTVNPGVASPVVVESRVTLDLADYFLRVARDRFPFPASPQSTSMWDEAQRLTGLPVFRSIPDRTLPTAITYDEDRLEALEKVFGPSNAWPALTSQGALTAMPKEWTEPVGRIETVLDAPLGMRSENVYNRVVVEGKNPETDGPVLRGVAEITDGFLRVRNRDGSRSPFGGSTYFYKSDFLTTQAQCQAYADELLPQVSRLRSVTRRLTEPFNPLREIGDVLVFADPTRGGDESLVRVRKIEHSGATTVTEVEVRT